MELRKAGLDAESKKPITVTYENEIVGEFIADIVVNATIILELSCLSCHPVKS
ncbi:MAG TPA: GxxExxY protein [Candidatus Wunengus sp. YC63]|uniref:GxxExxY protein n=1 Tax=Candidatus Wunengus sp. YC63 TaxID=3367699 RepID=UPI001D806C78|nr:GxxExxY protein [Planctomycetota bacterium]